MYQLSVLQILQAGETIITIRTFIQLFSWPWLIEKADSSGLRPGCQVMCPTALLCSPHASVAEICSLHCTTIASCSIPGLILADSTFPSIPYILKRYSQANLSAAQRRFNYVHSQSRIVVENAFGHLKMKFRKLVRFSERNPDNAKYSVLACLVLHNLTLDIPPMTSEPFEPPTPLYLSRHRETNALATRMRDCILPLYQ